MNEPGTYTFTRESLMEALTRLEIKISLYSPETLTINAESMADAIIKALGHANCDCAPETEGPAT